MKSKFFITVVLTVSAAWAQAEEAPLTTRIRLLSVGEAPRQVALISDGISTVVNLPDAARSETINYSGPAQLELREEGGTGRTLAVELPRTASRLLIVLLPGGLASKALVLDDSETGFPEGTIQFSNQAGTGLDLAVGEKAAGIATGATTLLEFPKNKPAAIVKIANEGGGETIFSNNWAISPGTRTLVLILPPESGSSNRPRVLRLPETLPIKR